MNMSQSEIQELMMVPAALVLFAIVFVAVLVVQGFSLKWAVNLCDAGPIGFFYGLLTSIVMGIGGGITTVGIALGTGTTNQWILMLYSMTAGIIIMMLMVQCNPFKAFLAYLCHTVFTMIGMVGVVIVALLMLMSMAKANMVKLPKNSPAMVSPVQTSWGSSSSTPTTTNTQFSPSDAYGVQSNPFAK